MTISLSHLTIKPIHNCFHRCPYCISRYQLLKNSSDVMLGVEDWARVFSEADRLGVEYLDISGGEPILYKGLIAIIWEAKRHGWFVSLNSSGWNLANIQEELINVSLDQVVISIVSLKPKLQDKLRCRNGSSKKLIESLKLLKTKSIRLILHFLINKYNYTELPDLIDFSFSNKANGLSLIYPEDDHVSKNLLMNDSEISHFKSEILPESLKRYQSYRPKLDISHQNLSSLFENNENNKIYSQGKYWKNMSQVLSNCTRPNMFMLIYPNGNVLPCNGVEYSHVPIVGNVLRQNLQDIFYGNGYNDFRNKRVEYCINCPVKCHTGIAIKTADNPPYAAPVIRKVPENLPQERPLVPKKYLYVQ